MVVEDATCLACGCLCDDIALTVQDERIVEARHACTIGRSWFLKDRGGDNGPDATVEGRPATFEEAASRAAEVLGSARAPVVLGLTGATIEAQGAAVALADRIGATVLLGHEADASPRVRAFRRVGMVSATLGEVRDRADLIIFWGVDPIATHPRHWERYSVDPPGRFVPEGRAGRTVVVFDGARTATAERADASVAVAPECQFEVLWALRAFVRGIEMDPGRVESATGLLPDRLRNEAERMKRARYGAFFFGPGLGRGPDGEATIAAALTLVRDLNESTRFVALALGPPGNAAGAEAVLAWQSGYSLGVEFAPGWPRLSAAPPLSLGEADAALIVADDPSPGLPVSALEQLRRIPRVVVSPATTPFDADAAVVLRTATPGIHAPGTVMRSDGITLPLRPPIASNLPTDRACLAAIANLLHGPGSGT